MSREEALTLWREFQETVSRGDIPAIMSYYAPDAIAVSPVFGEVKGLHAIEETWKTLFATLSDVETEVSDVLVDGNRVVSLGKVTSTDRAGWFGQPPTGGIIEYRIAWLLTFDQKKIIRDERIYDSSGVLARVEKTRVDKELKTAAEVQRALLPRTAYSGSFCESVGDSVPCRAIGGDFFEFIGLQSGAVGIAIGDVAGKGPAAALLAAMIQGMLTTEAAANGGPAAILSRMNRRLAARALDARFATLVYAELFSDGKLVYCNAGHNPPALLTGSGIARLTTGGPIVGAFADAIYEQETLRLRDRDTLVMFTDGATEAINAQDEEFGDDRLLAHLATDASSAPIVLLQRIFSAVREFFGRVEQADDITATVTRFRA